MKENIEANNETDEAETTEQVQTITRAKLDSITTIDLSANELVTMLPEEWTTLARQKNIY